MLNTKSKSAMSRLLNIFFPFFRQIKSANSLELDERSKQDQANNLYALKIEAENRGDRDLAAKLDRDYKVNFIGNTHCK